MNELRTGELRQPPGAAYEMMEAVLQPDEERVPLCRDCADWDMIPQALAGCAITILALVQDGRAGEAVRLMRTMAESLYALGYQRGRREARRPTLQLVLAEGER
jgi:hypothetical protein